MVALHYEARKHMRTLYKEDRWGVLTMLIMHADIRNRCWPSIDLLSHEMGISPNKVTTAKKWLLEHRAIELVPYDKRVGKEAKLPARQHVYQLTGVVQIDNQSIPYLFFNPEVNVTDGSNFKPKQFTSEVTDGDNIDGDNITVGNRSIESPSQDNSTEDVNTKTTPRARDDVPATQPTGDGVASVHSPGSVASPAEAQPATTPSVKVSEGQGNISALVKSDTSEFLDVPAGCVWIASADTDQPEAHIKAGHPYRGPTFCQKPLPHRNIYNHATAVNKKRPCRECMLAVSEVRSLTVTDAKPTLSQLAFARAEFPPEPPRDLELDMMRYAILQVTGMDYKIIKAVDVAAKCWLKAGYRAEHINVAWEVCRHADWRWTSKKDGNPDRKMDLKELERYLGSSKLDNRSVKYLPEMGLEDTLRRIRAAGTLKAVNPDWTPALEAGEQLALEPGETERILDNRSETT